MGIPSITERKHYRVLPGDPEEHTSTIVLTSKDSNFVDIRLLRETYDKESTTGEYSLACIDWAFAGRSHSKQSVNQENGASKSSHTLWDHWIDSRSTNPAIDEGDMWVQENGDVLERGKQKDPTTGQEAEYEELWHDLDVVALGKKQNHNSLVMRADNSEREIRGLAVKVGGWCQAMLRVGNELTVERWQWKSTMVESHPAVGEKIGEGGRTYNGWERAFRVGRGTLPCQYMCSHTSDKVGLNATRKYQTDDDRESAIDWKVLEEYYW